MAQTGVSCCCWKFPTGQENCFISPLLTRRFRRPVVPGDQLRIEVTVLKSRPNFSKVHGIAFVNGEIAAEATLRCNVG